MSIGIAFLLFTYMMKQYKLQCKYIFTFNLFSFILVYIIAELRIYGEFVIHTHSLCLMRQDSVRKKIQGPNTIPSINLGRVLNLEVLQFLYLQNGVNHIYLFWVL